ncbi:MAG: mechanosensitive ion channel family protein [Phycisphaerae bacterium]
MSFQSFGSSSLPMGAGLGSGHTPALAQPPGPNLPEPLIEDLVSVDRVFNLMEEIGLRQIFVDTPLFGWGMLVVGIFLGLLVGRLLATALRRIGRRIDGDTTRLRSAIFLSVASPVSLAVFTVGLRFGLAGIAMSPGLRDFAARVVALLLLTAVGWFFYNLVEIVDVLLRRLTARTRTGLDDMIVPLVRKTMRILLVIVFTLAVAENVFDANVGAFLAGLGIAGLAVSLAAQDSIKNLFGSITILVDNPFSVGERIVFSGHDGFVEEIGFRSTKIRTLTGHLVTVPNSEIVNNAVENIGRRPSIRRVMEITLTYDTPPEKMQEATRILAEIFAEPEIARAFRPDTHPPRIYFSDFNDASLGIKVYYWHFPPDYWVWTQHANLVNLRVLERFNAAGLDFAFPTQTLYLAGDTKRPLNLGVRPEAISSRDEG